MLIFSIGTNADTYSSTDKLELEVQEADRRRRQLHCGANADITN